MLLKVLIWNKKTFPNITLFDQVNKLKEEIHEFLESKSYEELADCYIACYGIFRFSPKLCFKLLKLLKNYKCDKKKLKKHIKKKLNINKKRTWKNNHHILMILLLLSTPIKAEVVKFNNVYHNGKHIFKYYKKIIVNNRYLYCDLQDKVEVCKTIPEWVEWRKQNPIKTNNEDMSYLQNL